MNIKDLLIVGLLVFFLFVDVPAQQNKCSLPDKLFGLTTEEGTFGNSDEIINKVRDIRDKTGIIPVVRIVFQYDEKNNQEIPPGKYLDTVERLHGKKSDCSDRIAFVMGLLVDSSAVKNYINKPEGENMTGKAARFYEKLKDYVDIWEVGNELNGTWVGWANSKEAELKSSGELEEMRKGVGRQTADVFNFLQNQPEIKAGKVKTALNLYFYDNECNQNCREQLPNCKGDCSENYEMIQWSLKYLKPEDRKIHFDYVLFSFYEDDCQPDDKPIKVNTGTWLKAFSKLSSIFSSDGHSPKIGFGEVGRQCRCARENDDGDGRGICPGDCGNQQSNYVTNYYEKLHSQLKNKRPDYVGGFFYWTFYQDARIDDPASNKVFNAFVKAAQKEWR